MGDWPSPIDGQYVLGHTNNWALSTLMGCQGGLANTKGNYTELIAATAVPASGLIVQFKPSNNNLQNYLADIAIGAAGSEVVIIANIEWAFTSRAGIRAYLPIAIPAGTRIAARSQCTEASIWVDIAAYPVIGGFVGGSPLSICTTYGSVTASSRGTIVDPGAVANTKGAWTQIAAATTYPIRALMVAFGAGGDLGRANPQNWLVDIGIGANPNELAIIPDLAAGHLPAEFVGVMDSLTGPIPCHIPAGTRLSARAQCDVIAAGDRLMSVSLYGLT